MTDRVAVRSKGMTNTATHWLTLDAAADRLGISVRTLHRQIQAGQHQVSKQPNGRVLVEILPTDEAVQADQQDQRLTIQLSGMSQAVLTAQTALAVVQAQLERTQATADDALTQLSQATKRGHRWTLIASAACVTLAASATWHIHQAQQAQSDTLTHTDTVAALSRDLTASQQATDRAMDALSMQQDAFTDILRVMPEMSHKSADGLTTASASPGAVGDINCDTDTDQQ